jgi:hypothetical protein
MSCCSLSTCYTLEVYRLSSESMSKKEGDIYQAIHVCFKLFFFPFFGEAKEHFVDDCHFVTGTSSISLCTIWLDIYLSAIQCQKPDFQKPKNILENHNFSSDLIKSFFSFLQCIRPLVINTILGRNSSISSRKLQITCVWSSFVIGISWLKVCLPLMSTSHIDTSLQDINVMKFVVALKQVHHNDPSE